MKLIFVLNRKIIFSWVSKNVPLVSQHAHLHSRNLSLANQNM